MMMIIGHQSAEGGKDLFDPDQSQHRHGADVEGNGRQDLLPAHHARIRRTGHPSRKTRRYSMN